MAPDDMRADGAWSKRCRLRAISHSCTGSWSWISSSWPEAANERSEAERPGAAW